MRITDLIPGETYVVAQSFRDARGTLALEGDEQTFERLSFGPAGVFEVVFRQETLFLHTEDQSDVTEHTERFLRLAD